MDAAGSEITKHKVTAGAKEKAVEKLRVVIEESEQQIAELEKQRERMREVWQEIEAGAFAVHDNYERVKKVGAGERRLLGLGQRAD